MLPPFCAWQAQEEEVTGELYWGQAWPVEAMTTHIVYSPPVLVAPVALQKGMGPGPSARDGLSRPAAASAATSARGSRATEECEDGTILQLQGQRTTASQSGTLSKKPHMFSGLYLGMSMYLGICQGAGIQLNDDVTCQNRRRRNQ